MIVLITLPLSLCPCPTHLSLIARENHVVATEDAQMQFGTHMFCAESIYAALQGYRDGGRLS